MVDGPVLPIEIVRVNIISQELSQCVVMERV